MRILAIGDPHIRADDLDGARVMCARLVAMAREARPDCIVLLGDTLHTHERVHTLAFRQAVALIRALAELAELFVLIGNHDFINNSQFMTDNHPFGALREWPSVTVVDRALRVERAGYALVLAPYVPPGRFQEALDTVRWRDAAVVFAHQEFRGARMTGGFASQEGDPWPDDWPLVVSGHIHGAQWVGRRVVYVGVPRDQEFVAGETQRHLALITLRADGARYDTLPTRLPRKHKICLDLPDAKRFRPDASAAVKLVVRAPRAELKTFARSAHCRELQKNGVRVSLEPTDALSVVPDVIPRETGGYRRIFDALVARESAEVRQEHARLWPRRNGEAVEPKPRTDQHQHAAAEARVGPADRGGTAAESA